MDFPGAGMIAGVLGSIALITLPAIAQSPQMDTLSQTYVMDKTAKFVDAIRNDGYLNEDMLWRFNKQLTATRNAYQIRITHEHRVIMPVYDEDGNFKDDTKVIYENTYEEDILKEIYEGDGEYEFCEGDQISVVVESKNKTVSQKLVGFVTGRAMDYPAIKVSYGGRIRDDLQ